MRYWDSSSLVPLLVEETRSPACRELLSADPDLVVWALTHVELATAIRRLERESRLDRPGCDLALDRLAALTQAWAAVAAYERVGRRAVRLVAVHPLTAADALQLAAALELVDDRPDTVPFVTNDRRLAAAARLEGFPVLEPGP